MELYVKGTKIEMNEFVNKVLHDVVMAILSHLRDIEIEGIERIDIS
ncbi:MAG: hypothetical protein ACFFAY_13790 [Promethearchaeota archaeon]